MDLTEVLVGIVATLLATVIYFHVRAFTYWSSRNIKGPLPVPIFGTNIYYLLWEKLECDIHWRKKYGKVYGLYEGYSPLLRVTDNELLKFIYIKEFQSFTDRHNEFVNDPVQKGWMLWSEGARWAGQRALVAPMFSGAKMRAMLPKISEGVNKFLVYVDELCTGVPINNNNKESIDNTRLQKDVMLGKSDITNLTLDVIATNFFGLQLDTYKRKKEDKFILEALEFSKFSLTRFMLWNFVPRQLARLFQFNLLAKIKFEYFDRLAKKLIESRRRNPEESSEKFNDLIQHFIDAKLPDGELKSRTNKAALKKGMTDLEIRGQMTFMLVAGFETTATTIGLCMYELSHQREVQDKLFEELSETFKDDLQQISSVTGEFPSDRYSDLIALEYLDAFVSEVLRMYSPLIDHSRRVVERVQLPTKPNPIWLPVGMPISSNGYILQRDHDYFENADTFDVTRFLPENRHKIIPGTYMPFGAGPRHCAGMRFAMLEIKLALCKTLLNYQVLPGHLQQYPPKFQRNAIFLLLENSEFILAARRKDAATDA